MTKRVQCTDLACVGDCFHGVTTQCPVQSKHRPLKCHTRTYGEDANVQCKGARFSSCRAGLSLFLFVRAIKRLEHLEDWGSVGVQHNHRKMPPAEGFCMHLCDVACCSNAWLSYEADCAAGGAWTWVSGPPGHAPVLWLALYLQGGVRWAAAVVINLRHIRKHVKGTQPASQRTVIVHGTCSCICTAA